MQININGAISFTNTINNFTEFDSRNYPWNTTAILAPYWGDVDVSTVDHEGSGVYYRFLSPSSCSSALLSNISSTARRYIPFKGFIPTWGLILTWYNVHGYEQESKQVYILLFYIYILCMYIYMYLYIRFPHIECFNL